MAGNAGPDASANGRGRPGFRPSRRLIGLVMLAVVLGGGLIGALSRRGADRAEQAQLDRGAVVFRQACAGCHRLHANGAQNGAGPEPFDRVQPDEPTVRRWVEQGGNGMPALGGRLSPQQIGDVAAYVAAASRSPLSSQ